MDRTPIAFDLETHLAFETAPKVVCLSWWDGEEGGVLSNADDLEGKMRELLQGAVDGKYLLIAQNAKFDLTCLHRHYPNLRPLIYKVLEVGGVSDTMLREKLWDLSTVGHIGRRGYSLSAFTKKYLGVNIDHTKSGEDVWRLNYKLLDGIPAIQWKFLTIDHPVTGKAMDGREAYQYALDDTILTLGVWLEQEKMRQRDGYGSMNTEELQVSADFCLDLWAQEGMRLDPVQVDKMKDTITEAINPLVRPVSFKTSYLKCILSFSTNFLIYVDRYFSYIVISRLASMISSLGKSSNESASILICLSPFLALSGGPYLT
jgi:hypothetical protein